MTPNDILGPDLTTRLCSLVYDEAELIGSGGCSVVVEARKYLIDCQINIT